MAPRTWEILPFPLSPYPSSDLQLWVLVLYKVALQRTHFIDKFAQLKPIVVVVPLVPPEAATSSIASSIRVLPSLSVCPKELLCPHLTSISPLSRSSGAAAEGSRWTPARSCPTTSSRCWTAPAAEGSADASSARSCPRTSRSVSACPGPPSSPCSRSWETTARVFIFTQSLLFEPVLPQAAQLGIHFYCFHSTQLEMHLLEGPD